MAMDRHSRTVDLFLHRAIVLDLECEGLEDFITAYSDKAVATDEIDVFLVPKYTESLDAVIELVEGHFDSTWAWCVDRWGNATLGQYRAYSAEIESELPSYALLTAMVRALAARPGKSNPGDDDDGSHETTILEEWSGRIRNVDPLTDTHGPGHAGS